MKTACLIEYDNGVIINAVALWSDCNNELIALEGVNEEDAHTVVYSYNETKEAFYYSEIWGFSYNLELVK